jgi:hypothetical protein
MERIDSPGPPLPGRHAAPQRNPARPHLALPVADSRAGGPHYLAHQQQLLLQEIPLMKYMMPTVFIVDDDPAVRDSLALLIMARACAR